MPPHMNAGAVTAAAREAKEREAREKRDERADDSLPRNHSRPSSNGLSSRASIHDLDVPDAMLQQVKGPRAREFLTFVQAHGTRRAWCLATKILMWPAFDYILGFIILGNMVIMIIEVDRSAQDEEEVASSGSEWTELVGTAVLGIFIAELILRLFVFRLFFWKDAWNIFDFTIVVVDSTVSLIGIFVGEAFPVSILRIFRMCKLARAAKVLRVFPELRLLLAGLIGSISAIFWGTFLLILFLLIWSMVAVLFIHPLTKHVHFADCDGCENKFSSVYQCTLTFWQTIVVGDNWGAMTMPIIQKFPLSIFFFLPMFLSVGMAVMNLLLGVVVTVAMQSQDQLREEDDLEHRLTKLEKQTHILDLCAEMDPEGTGELSREAVWKGYQEEGEFRWNMQALEISEDDLQIMWTMMDPEKIGKVTYRELMSRLYSIRDSDTSFMLTYIKYYITEIRLAIMERLDNQHKEDVALEKELLKEVHKVENEVLHVEQKEDMLERQVETLIERDAPPQVVGAWEPLFGTRKQDNGKPQILDTTFGIFGGKAESTEVRKPMAAPTSFLPSVPSVPKVVGKSQTGMAGESIYTRNPMTAPNSVLPSVPPLAIDTKSARRNESATLNETVESLQSFWQQLNRLQFDLKVMLSDMGTKIETQAVLVTSKQQEVNAKLKEMAKEFDLSVENISSDYIQAALSGRTMLYLDRKSDIWM